MQFHLGLPVVGRENLAWALGAYGGVRLYGVSVGWFFVGYIRRVRRPGGKS